MPRNFYRRVEVMFPVESPALRKRILNEIIPAYAADNVKARELSADGTYRKVIPKKSSPPFRCQQALMDDTVEEQLQSKSDGRTDRAARRSKKKK